MREAPRSVVEALQRYDSALRLIWVERHPKHGHPVQRFGVFRHPGPRKLFFVMWVKHHNPSLIGPRARYGDYREPGMWLIEHLAERDTWRAGGRDDEAWDAYKRREFMNKLGMKDSADDPFKEEHELIRARADEERKADVADRIRHALDRAPEQVYGVDKGEMLAAEQRAVALEEYHQQNEGDEGDFVKDPKTGIPKRVR